MARFVNIDRDTPMLLPPDLRDWIPCDHLVHFVIDAIESIDTSCAQINHRGTGNEQGRIGSGDVLATLPPPRGDSEVDRMCAALGKLVEDLRARRPGS